MGAATGHAVNWKVPLAIFAIKTAEYLLGVLTTRAIVRGQASIAAGITLADTIIWISTLSFTIHRRDWRSYLAYALGAGLGTYLGAL